MITIPYDLYESQYEIVIFLPLWWVKKESIVIKIEEHKLIFSWNRKKEFLREDLVARREECFWWEIECRIDLPPNIIYQNIHSTLSKENILTVILPKIIIPKQINVVIED